MELSHPLATVTPSIDGDVLRALAMTTSDFTPGQLRAVLGERSVAGIRRALDRLALQGVVHRRLAGLAYLYSLNRQHLSAEPVIALARSRERLIERLATHVETWGQSAIFGAVFGSALRPDHGPFSDLDLLLVYPQGADIDVWSAQVSALTSAATSWTGNDARVLEYSDADVHRHRADPVLGSILAEGVTFVGDLAWLRAAIGPSPTDKGRE